MSQATPLLSMILIFFAGLTAAQDQQAAQKQKSGNKVSQRRQNQHPPKIDGATVEVYKTVGDVELNAWIFQPATVDKKANRPVAVFFFGGGWKSGSPSQFVPHCQHLAERGMVGIVVDYRVASRHNVKMTSCVADAKSAIRWVRENADRLGIDPNRIVAGGGSAGGHLAAATALLNDFDEPTDNKKTSCRPNAMLLFNPALVLAPIAGQQFFDEAKVERFRQNSGGEPEKVSPYHSVSTKVPPAIIFHGKSDTTVPYRTVELFTKKMTENGNRCELVGYEGQGHGFFNARNSGGYYQKTVAEMDRFLVSLGYLDPVKPEITPATKTNAK